MTTHRGRSLTAIAVALAVLLMGTATVFAVTSQLSAKGNMLVRIASEDGGSGPATANSTTYVDIPGASLTVNAPDKPNGSVLIARFQAHVSIIQAPGCIVRLVANDTVMEPDGNYAFAGEGDVGQSVATSGAIERSLHVTHGTYTVKAHRIGETRFGQSCSLVLPFHLSIPMNSISVSFHPQKEPVVCPQCGSTARVARDLCLRCMLLLGIAACGDTSEILNDAVSEIDVQDAEHVVEELGPTFPVVRSTSESTPQTERQCAEKLTF